MPDMKIQRTVLQVGGLNWATSAAIVERTLRRRPGWFHPNDRGHRVWADAFWNVLRLPGAPSRAERASENLHGINTGNCGGRS